jgi:ABC-type uncharacterized transport system ATPase subunit
MLFRIRYFEVRTSIENMSLNKSGIRRRYSLAIGRKYPRWWDLPAADGFQPHREIDSLPAAESERNLAEPTERLGVEKLTYQAVRGLSPGEPMKMERIAAPLH